MAGGWPLSRSVCNWQSYGVVTSAGTVLTGGAANTKGSYTQLVASTSADAVGIILQVNNRSAGANEYSVDVAVGGSGSEQIIIPDFIMQNDHAAADNVYFPILIPAGTRIAARCQSPSAGGTMTFAISTVDGEFTANEGAGSVDTYGFLSSTTNGTLIDPGGVANTDGSWVQITASTTNDICGVVLGLDPGNLSGASSLTGQMLMDIGIGGSGNEQVLIPNLMVEHAISNGAINSTWPPYIGPIPVQIPSGTRIAARCQSTLTTATQRQIGLVVYGIRANS